ncbi:MAG: hypothetical protein K9J13_15805 [Saprospiraceae bacterium]|nr:hypothetical protein [Saprospiraceae bacterium]
MRTFKILFSLIVGVAILGIWCMLFFSGKIPEFRTEPIRILMHIAAEIITALSLIISGILILNKSKFSDKIFLFSIGMLTYTLIVSPGYYLNKGEFAMVYMFGVLFCLTIFLLLKEFFLKIK